MAIQKITIEQFLALAVQYPVLDVRSPGEYTHAHIPGAYSLPLFTDEERKIVGTAYKQESKQVAIKLGLDHFGVKMRRMVEDVEFLLAERKKQIKKQRGVRVDEPTNTIIVHCWRGGMRSAGVAWLLDLYGFTVYTLVGGYKAYRRWARMQFEQPYDLSILGGYTGSGKTMVLKGLKKDGATVINLEELAKHKGSAFGALGEEPQPTQEMFENLLAEELYAAANSVIINIAEQKNQPTTRIYIEDESQRIGRLNIPTGFWDSMRISPVYFLDIPFEERLNYITEGYGKFDKEKLVNSIIRIQKRLGGLETKTAINYLLENNHKECFRILLLYYDKLYNKSLLNRESLPALLNKIPSDRIDVKTIIHKLSNEKTIIQ